MNSPQTYNIGEITNNKSNDKIAIIMGAGPAGLAAAYELALHSDIKPIVIEMDGQVGGLAKTIDYEGWRFDIGPHRFFSKSPEINKLWEEILPKQGQLSQEDKELGRKLDLSDKLGAPNPDEENQIMLVKQRLTRIYHRRRFFDYPIKLSFSNLKKLGGWQVISILSGYIWARLKPIKPEKNLEDFFINRFGRPLYETFFKDYTEKVWGVSCQEIPKSWGAQRVKQLSVSKIISEAVKQTLKPNRKTSETSLIDSFLYPKFGAGQMFEEMAKKIITKGGIIKTSHQIIALQTEGKKIISLRVKNLQTGNEETIAGDFFLSSLAIKDLVEMMDGAARASQEIAAGLSYRDLILVALAYNHLSLKNKTKIKTRNDLIPDNWIYVQEKGAKLGRLDIFNNFSPWMLKNQDKVLIGAEYFCQEGNAWWQMSDTELIEMASTELATMGIAEKDELITGNVHRQTKAYPAYLGSYNRFSELKDYLNSWENIFLIGRNGQHRYNNMDHSMLTGLKAAQALINYQTEQDLQNSKHEIWQINTEDDYHEKK